MSNEMEEQENAVRKCVREFYEQAKRDDLLGPVFNRWISNWDKHLTTMDDFWSGALLGTKRYDAAPFPPHLKLEMDQRHFDRWGDLWRAAASATLPDPLNAKALSIGEHLSHCWGRAHTTMTRQEA